MKATVLDHVTHHLQGVGQRFPTHASLNILDGLPVVNNLPQGQNHGFTESLQML